MLRIAICEQKTAVLQELTDFTARYAGEKSFECTAESFDLCVDDTSVSNKFDAVFIDIGFNDGQGASFAKKLRGSDPRIQIVFISDQGEFSVKGNEVDAVDFLTLPTTYYAFSTLLDRIQNRIVKTETHAIALMTKQGARRVSADNVTYIESNGLNTVYHTIDGDINVRGSISDAEKKLTADRFFRLGKYLINLSHVYKVSGFDVYVGTTCLPLPLRKKSELIGSLLAFMNRG